MLYACLRHHQYVFVSWQASTYNKSILPNILFTIYPILTCLKVLITHEKLSDWVIQLKERDERGFPKAGREAPRNFPRVKPEGNPEKQHCQPEKTPIYPGSFTWINILFKIGHFVDFSDLFKYWCLKKRNCCYNCCYHIIRVSKMLLCH